MHLVSVVIVEEKKKISNSFWIPTFWISTMSFVELQIIIIIITVMDDNNNSNSVVQKRENATVNSLFHYTRTQVVCLPREVYKNVSSESLQTLDQLVTSITAMEVRRAYAWQNYRTIRYLYSLRKQIIRVHLLTFRSRYKNKSLYFWEIRNITEQKIYRLTKKSIISNGTTEYRCASAVCRRKYYTLSIPVE